MKKFLLVVAVICLWFVNLQLAFSETKQEMTDGLIQLPIEKGELYVSPTVKEDENHIRYTLWLYQLDEPILSEDGKYSLAYISAVTASECSANEIMILTGILMDKDFNGLGKLNTSRVVNASTSMIYTAVNKYVCKP